MTLLEATWANHNADYVSLCRPLIREPGLVKGWQVGDRRMAECILDKGVYDGRHTGARRSFSIP